jgi:hypothetical protein
MPGLAVSQAKAASSKVRDARHKLWNLHHAGIPANGKTSAYTQAAHELLESTLTKTGFDPAKVNVLREQNELEWPKRRAKSDADADQRSSAMLDTVSRGTENWRATVTGFKTLGTANFQRFLLDTAAEISATSEITVASTQTAATNNTAQFRLDTTQSSGTEEVSFGFFWQNPSDKFAVVNVDGYLVLTAICQAIDHGGILAEDRFSRLAVDANLHISELWNDPPTSPIGQPSQSQRALTVSVENTGWFDDGEIVNQDLFRGYDLQYGQFVMPLVEPLCLKSLALFPTATRAMARLILFLRISAVKHSALQY